MEANEAPEKLYVGLRPSISGGYVYTTVNKDSPNAVEYIRTDTFIEKALRWMMNTDGVNYMLSGEMIEDFKNHMKGE